MPYCKKCGAKLGEDAKFCQACGTPVAEPMRKRMERKERKPRSLLAIVAIAIIVTGMVAAVVAFLPLRVLDLTETRDVPFQTGVDVINLNLTMDVGSFNVAFLDLDDKMVSLRLSITGLGSIILPEIYGLSFDHASQGNVLTVSSEVDTSPSRGWWGLSRMQVTCDLLIDRSLNASLDITVGVGKIILETQAGTVVNSLNLETTTGSVETSLVENTVVAGDLSFKTVTGGVDFSWRNSIAEKGISVNLETVTGGASINLVQDERLQGNVGLYVDVTTGGVDLALDIQSNVGARIVSSTTVGSIDILRSDGFSGSEALLQSDNYPAGRDFDINLKTTTGGIDINASHTP
ncbi:MAG: zinc-ribbon domain-containing protein [Candidatus Bathyarchaeota archaeon]|nr:zinc-ribbon domain-containing protein [Candidatus Bathyarchaeota archaeon]